MSPTRKLLDGKNFDELRCLTLQKSAELSRISTRTLKGIIQLKELPAIRVGHQWCIHKKRAIKWFQIPTRCDERRALSRISAQLSTLSASTEQRSRAKPFIAAIT